MASVNSTGKPRLVIGLRRTRNPSIYAPNYGITENAWRINARDAGNVNLYDIFIINIHTDILIPPRTYVYVRIRYISPCDPD